MSATVTHLPRSTVTALNIYEFLTLELPERSFLLNPIIPQQGLALLYAPRGLGKTYAALSIALAVASGG